MPFAPCETFIAGVCIAGGNPASGEGGQFVCIPSAQREFVRTRKLRLFGESVRSDLISYYQIMVQPSKSILRTTSLIFPTSGFGLFVGENGTGLLQSRARFTFQATFHAYYAFLPPTTSVKRLLRVQVIAEISDSSFSID